MKRTLRLTILFLFTYSLLFGQSPKNGYIVKLNNDTLRGEIKQRTFFTNQVTFKAPNQSTFKDYSTDSIKAFYFEENKFFEALQFPANDKNTTFIFAQILVNGTTKLYMAYEKKRDIFFLKKGNELIKLTKQDSTYLPEGSSKSVFREDSRYKGLLIHYLGDCPSLKSKLSTITFSPESLIRIVNQYNKCIGKNNEETAIKDSSPIKTAAGIKFGLGTRTVDFLQPGSTYRSYDYNSTLGYMFGGFFNITYRNVFAVQPELVINRTGAKGSKVLFSNTIINNEIKVTYLEVPVSLIYTLNIKGIQPYFLVGAVAGMALHKETNESYLDYKGDLRTSEMKIDKFNELGFRLGLGGKVKTSNEKRKFLLEVVYQRAFANRNVLEEIAFDGITACLGYEF